MLVEILPDTLLPGEVEVWLRRHDMLRDAWTQVIADAAATAPAGGPG